MPKKYISLNWSDSLNEPSTIVSSVGMGAIHNLRNNEEMSARLRRGLPLYEEVCMETVGEESTENRLILGDCLSACALLRERDIQVDLVYIDPPFASNAEYTKKVFLRPNPNQEGGTATKEKFVETMYGDHWSREEYLHWMYENLVAIRSIMSETASIYVHLDWHIGHYVKLLLDEIFGSENFVNEIIWSYKSGGGSRSHFGRKHDTIFFYSRSEKKTFHIQKEKSYNRGLKPYNFKNVEEFQDEVGWHTMVNMRDVWDISMVGRTAEERVDYATQKPEALLRRIIQASSSEGMLVADFFGGSGVTAKVAHTLKRNFIHVDVGMSSIQIARDRLRKACASFSICRFDDGISLFRNPTQTMDHLQKMIPALLACPKKIGRFWCGVVEEDEGGLIPVFFPNLLNTREKVLDVLFLRRVLPEIEKVHLHNPHLTHVIFYYVDLENEREITDFLKKKNLSIGIRFEDAKPLLKEHIKQDTIDFSVEQIGEEYRIVIVHFESVVLKNRIDVYNQKMNNPKRKRAKNKQTNPPRLIQLSEHGLELVEFLSLDCTDDSGAWNSDVEIRVDKEGYTHKDGLPQKNLWDGCITAHKRPKRLKIRNISGDECIQKIHL